VEGRHGHRGQVSAALVRVCMLGHMCVSCVWL
jgi:hypothetical protein